MPISIEALCTALKPTATALLLGAGASIPSGAPSGAALAGMLWKRVAGTPVESDDLQETATILERSFSRRSVVDVIVATLKPLTPTGGLLGLPRLGWQHVYTTNFDRLLEQAYQVNGIPLTAIRSNYEFSYKESRQGVTLYKLHGCITQDRSIGDKSSMILTEQDYEDFDQYRQSLFASLQAHMLVGDVLIIGHSLRDRHLNDLVKKVLTARAQGAPANVYVLVYEKDDRRAPLLEDRGARVAFGGLDEFIHAMAARSDAKAAQESAPDEVLPLSLSGTVHEVSHAKHLPSNVLRMFNGSAASYADIRLSATFERATFAAATTKLNDESFPLVVIVGAAGVGKTTFARQLLLHFSDKGALAYEHRNDFSFDHTPWTALEARLRERGTFAVLLLDECARYLRQVNLLVDHLASIERPALRLVLTANAAQWAPRVKTKTIFSKGKLIELRTLVDPELHSLINLLQYNKSIADLVQTDFKSLARSTQFSRLRERCSADMFVCLKNIFASERLDNILLAEFSDLPEVSQDHYRYVAALESVGMRVHRQLVMRILNIPADQIAAALSGLEGIVDEFDIRPAEGIFGWATRHLVIARKITEYKFSSVSEIDNLFRQIISNINPSVQIELQSIRDMCDVEFGIPRLGDATMRRSLYRELIRIAPAERIPWHRLIRELLEEGALEDAEHVIRDAIQSVGSDAPIDRYRVRLIVLRSERTDGISAGDRLALLRKAYELAEINVARHKNDKHSYRTLCEVAMRLVEKGEPSQIFESAIMRMRQAAEAILDPDMDRELARLESRRFRSV